MLDSVWQRFEAQATATPLGPKGAVLPGGFRGTVRAACNQGGDGPEATRAATPRRDALSAANSLVFARRIFGLLVPYMPLARDKPLKIIRIGVLAVFCALSVLIHRSPAAQHV